MTTRESRREYLSRIFCSHLSDLRTADLRQKRSEDIQGEVKVLYANWEQAYAGVIPVLPSDLVRFGLLLGRFAESYSLQNVAEQVLDQLGDDAAARVPWIERPAEILITSGEFNRRGGDLSKAETRFSAAVSILEEDLSVAEKGQRAHWELGRVFYEFAYLNRLRGDAAAAIAAIERSEVECELGGDIVGIEIAKSLQATVLYEEGMPNASIMRYQTCVARFEELVADPTIAAAGRLGFARRWLVNTRLGLGQAYLATGNISEARAIIESQVVDVSNGPSTLAMATARRIEAQLRLAENDLEGAAMAIGVSRQIINNNDENLTEGAATTLAIVGLVNALGDDDTSALSCFDAACGLQADLHNHRAQGWAWAGRAILARNAGDMECARRAVLDGLKCVERCGAPVRRFLLKLLRTNSDKTGPGLDELRQLVHSTD